MKRILFPSFAVLLCAALQVSAQPSGTFNYPGLGTGGQAIWDVSGTYPAGGAIDTQNQGALDLQFSITVVQDGKGKITGSGTGVQVMIGMDNVTGSYTVKGTVSGTGANPTVNLTVKLSGNGFIQGQQRSYKGTINYTLHVEPGTKHLVGTGTGNASASGTGGGNAPVHAAVDTPLPGGMDGTWSLALTLQPNKTKLGGTATVALSNGRALACTVKGTFTPATGSSALKLTGTGTGSGAKLGVNTTGGAQPLLNDVTGSALGITLN